MSDMSYEEAKAYLDNLSDQEKAKQEEQMQLIKQRVKAMQGIERIRKNQKKQIEKGLRLP